MDTTVERPRSSAKSRITGGGPSERCKMNSKEILDYLPHRYPFLLIDRVHDYEAHKFIKASKLVSTLDPYLQGHFPNNPVMPGVLIVECMAQASAILGRITMGNACNTCLLTEVSESRFKRPVVPGDVLQVEVNLLRNRQGFFWFDGEATIDGDIVAAAKFTAKLA